MKDEDGEQETVTFDEAKYWAMVQEKPTEFSTWTSLIAFIEKTDAADVEKICQVYGSFLHEFPLCYGYWKKYADHMLSFNLVDEAVEVYEEATKSLAYSVDHWLNYCGFALLWFDEAEDIRRLFERALGFVGKDYLNHFLWDKYIDFEFSQKQWSRLAHIYFRSLKFPNKQLDKFFQSFKQLSASWRDELGTDGDVHEVDGSIAINDGTYTNCNLSDITAVIDDLLSQKPHLAESRALEKYVSTCEQVYHKSRCLGMMIQQFETRIRRPYFHVKPLDNSQLENWHLYLDFAEAQADFDWIVKLYERCLIACANYMEFWVRYVQFMEAKGGREIAKMALARATQVFLKRIPAMHLFAARFKEQIRDISGARTEFLDYDSDFSDAYVENIIRKANMEKRLGNLEAAFAVYERALESGCHRQSFNVLSVLYTQYSQFKLKLSGMEASRDVLLKGIQQLPTCKLLLEALINFEAIHGGRKQMAALEPIIQKAICSNSDASDALNTNDREHISSLFLECVDRCGDIHQVKRAWDMHVKLFPYLFRPNSSKRNAITLAGIAGYKYPIMAELARHEPLVPTCDSALHGPPHHFTSESVSSQKKISNGAEVLRIQDEMAEQKIGPEGVKCHLEGNSSLDKLVGTVEFVNGANLELETQQTCHVHKESLEQSKIVSLTAKSICEVESQEQMQPDSDSSERKTEIALQPPPLETLSIDPPQHVAQPSSATSSREQKALPVASQSNGSSIRRRDDNTISYNYDQAGNPLGSSTRKQVQQSNTLQSAHDPSLQGAGTPNQNVRTMNTQVHQVIPVNSALPDNHNLAVANWQQMLHPAQPFTDSGYYAQQQQQEQVAAPTTPYLPTSEHPQVYLHQGYAYPPEYQYRVPPHAYPGNAQGWHMKNTDQCVSVASQAQQSTSVVPSVYSQGQPSQYAGVGNEQYVAMQTQQGFPWHIQLQQQQLLYQQQWQLFQHEGWNGTICPQTVHVQDGVNAPYQQEYGGQAATTQIAGTANPSYGAEAVSGSSSQAQASSSQENKLHSDTC